LAVWLRLSRFFGTSESFWLGLQMDYETRNGAAELAEILAQIQPWTAPHAS